MTLKIIWFLLVIPSAYVLLLWAVKSWKYGFWSQLLYSIILAFIVTFFFNKLPSVVQEEELVMQNFSDLKNLFQNRQNKSSFLTNNFIFINTAFDQVLIPMPGGEQDDQTVINLTNREQLISFFRLCNKHALNIDLVICDVYFEQSNIHDAELKRVMDSLVQNNKLVVSSNPFIKSNNLLNFPDTVSGDVSASLLKSLVFDYQLKPGRKVRLPYLAYQKLEKIRSVQPMLSGLLLLEKKPIQKRLVVNNFVPEMVFSEEDLSQRLPEINHSRELQSGQVSGPLTLNLSEANSPINQQLLPVQLSLRKQNKQKNIIILGAFGNTEADMHATVYGEMHGTTIIINVLYNLLNGRHSFSWLVFLLTTAAFFFITNSIIENAIEKRQMTEDAGTATNTSVVLKKTASSGLWNDILKFLKYLIGFLFVEERFFWILVAFAFFINLIFNQFVNVLALAIHFIILYAAVNYIASEIVKTPYPEK